MKPPKRSARGDKAAISPARVPESAPAFTDNLVRWQREHGRHDLPWQRTRDPYRVWLSEIMLQQTQVTTVIPYYERFLARFADVAALAAAPVDEVMRLWSGLGYYSRARNLHRAAIEIVERHGGVFPRDPEVIESLPGIGRSTAAAIAAFSFGTRAAILDGNVKRVLARCFGVEGFPGAPKVEASMWTLADALLPAADIESYTQGVMDLGATLCTPRNPQCGACPMSAFCVAHREGRIAELPAPKPRKTVPHRAAVMLVLSDGNDVLLEKRPPDGIWGGLWSFPQADDEAAALALARTRFGVTRAARRRLPTLRHGFTHFSLDITPLVLRVRRRDLAVDEPGAMWLAQDAARGAALPVPAKKVLAALLVGEQAALFEEAEEDL